MARIILSEKKLRLRSLRKKLSKLNIFQQLNPVDNRSGMKGRQSALFGPSLVPEVAACQPGPIKSGTAPIFLQVVIQATQRSGGTLVKNHQAFLPFPGADPENSERGGRDTCPLASYIYNFFFIFLRIL